MTTEASSAPVRGVPALLAAIVGTGLMVWGFLAGIDAALNGQGGLNTLYVVLFIAGLVLVVAALIMSVVRLVRGGPRALPVATLIVALLPLLAVATLWIRAAASL